MKLTLILTRERMEGPGLAGWLREEGSEVTSLTRRTKMS